MPKVLLTPKDRSNYGDNCLQGHHSRCKGKASYFPTGANRLAKCSCKCHCAKCRKTEVDYDRISDALEKLNRQMERAAKAYRDHRERHR